MNTGLVKWIMPDKPEKGFPFLQWGYFIKVQFRMTYSDAIKKSTSLFIHIINKENLGW